MLALWAWPRLAHARRVERQLATWESRWGTEAVHQFVCAVELYNTGAGMGVASVLVFVVAATLGASFVATGAVAVTFALAVPLMVAGVFQMQRATALIARRYGVSLKARPWLTLKRMHRVELFEAWVGTHGASGDRLP
jgi:hypothetical protein